MLKSFAMLHLRIIGELPIILKCLRGKTYPDIVYPAPYPESYLICERLCRECREYAFSC